MRSSLLVLVLRRGVSAIIQGSTWHAKNSTVGTRQKEYA